MELNDYNRKMAASWIAEARFNEAHSLFHMANACRRFAQQFFDQIR